MAAKEDCRCCWGRWRRHHDHPCFHSGTCSVRVALLSQKALSRSVAVPPPAPARSPSSLVLLVALRPLLREARRGPAFPWARALLWLLQRGPNRPAQRRSNASNAALRSSSGRKSCVFWLWLPVYRRLGRLQRFNNANAPANGLDEEQAQKKAKIVPSTPAVPIQPAPIVPPTVNKQVATPAVPIVPPTKQPTTQQQPSVVGSSPVAGKYSVSPSNKSVASASSAQSPVDVLTNNDEWLSEEIALVFGVALSPRPNRYVITGLLPTPQRFTASHVDLVLMERLHNLPTNSTLPYLFQCYTRIYEQLEKVGTVLHVV